MAEEIKDPSHWTPEEASAVEKQVAANPNDPGAAAATQMLLKYKNAQAYRKELERPEEYIPPRPPGLLGFKFLSPRLMGGVTEEFNPNDPKYFKYFQEKYPVIPPGADPQQLLKDFMAREWAAAHDSAVQRGVPIRRLFNDAPSEEWKSIEKKPEQMGMDPMKEIGTAAEIAQGWAPGLPRLAAAASTLPGAAAALLAKAVPGDPKLQKDLTAPGPVSPAEIADTIEKSREAIPPGSKLALNVLGSMLPGSPLRGLGTAVSRLGGEASGVMPGIAKGAAVGATMGAGAGAADDLTEALQGLTTGVDSGKKPESALARVLGTSSAGAILGGALGGFGGFSRGLRDTTDEASRALVSFENSGGTTHWKAKGGLRDPVEYSKFFPLKPNEHPFDATAREAVGPLLKGAQAEAAKVLAPIAAETEKAHAAYDAMGAKVNTEPLIKVIKEQLKRRTFQIGDAPAGQDLPIFNNAELRKQLVRASDVSVDNDQMAQKLIEGSGGVRVPLDEAIQMGIADMDTQVKVNASASPGGGGSGRATVPEGQAPVRDRVGSVRMTLGEALDQKLIDPRANSIAFSPRDLDARQADSIISEADRAAGISESSGAGKADPMWADWVRATREMRDQLPPLPGITDKYPDVTIAGPDGTPMVLTGRSAMAHAHSEEIGALRARMRQAGLSDQVDPGDAGDQEKAKLALSRLGPGRMNSDLTRQARALAATQPGGLKALDAVTIANLRGGPIPSEGPSVPSGINKLRAGAQLAGQFKYNVDPAARALGAAGPTASGILGPKVADPLTRSLMFLYDKLQGDPHTATGDRQ